MNLENLKKQAKQLVRWHREGNHSVGERVRRLPDRRELTDAEILATSFSLNESQEIIALEAGYGSWAELRDAVAAGPKSPKVESVPLSLNRALPVIYVSDVRASAEFYRDNLGFLIEFLHGHPAFYGAVSRDGATIHLRFVHAPVVSDHLREHEQLLSVFVVVENVQALYAEYKTADVEFVQTLKKEPWGKWTFIVRDRDNNWISFNG